MLTDVERETLTLSLGLAVTSGLVRLIAEGGGRGEVVTSNTKRNVPELSIRYFLTYTDNIPTSIGGSAKLSTEAKAFTRIQFPVFGGMSVIESIATITASLVQCATLYYADRLGGLDSGQLVETGE